MDDLNRAINMMKDAVDHSSVDSSEYAGSLNNLSVALVTRFDRIGATNDIDDAIARNEQALNLTQKPHPNYSKYLNNLGNALQARSQKTQSMDDLNRAIDLEREAVASTTENHPDRAKYLNNLANALQQRFELTKTTNDLDQAVTAIEQSVRLTSDNHPHLAHRLIDLASALECRFKQTKVEDDLEHAIRLNEEALALTTVPAFNRIAAASSAFYLLLRHKPYSKETLLRAKPLFRTAVELMPLISPRTLNRSDQQLVVSRFTGFTLRAVSLCLEGGDDPYEVLQLSELGRGILASLKLEIQFDISVLRASYPDLAEELCHIRDQLKRLQTESGRAHEPESRYVLFRQFEGLLKRIRTLEGFELFLLGLSKADLELATRNGPIVILNSSDIRSDAIILTREDVRSLPLPQLIYTEAQNNVEAFLRAIMNSGLIGYSKSRREVTRVLEWLWDVAVGPVLSELGFIETPSQGQVWPRMWWIGCGLLTLLPIHAAGYHNSNPPQSAIDRVISSYTPSVKSLVHCVEHVLNTRTLQTQKFLIIGMPKTPGWKDLPFVQDEIEELQKLASMAVPPTVMYKPTRAMVLSTLSDQQIVHLACHGDLSVFDPSQSRLVLEDWETESLTISDLMELDIPLSQFAFLSACHTAGTGDYSLLDESVTLASAVQLAGYPSVVGSLWRVEDKQSVQVVKEVYKWMLQGAEKIDAELAAEGLHWAIHLLREKTRNEPGMSRRVPSNPLVWAPYIHSGV